MKGLSGPQDSGAWRFLTMCAACALVLALCVVLLGSSLPLSQRRLVSDVALLAGGLLGAVSCGGRSRQATGRRRRAWLLFAAAMGAAALGNLWLLMVDLGLLPSLSERSSSLPFLIALLLGLAGLSAFPSVRRRGTDFARMLVDGIIIAGALISIANATVFPQLLTSVGRDPVSQLAVLLPALLDIALLTLVVLLMVRTGRADRPALAFLCGGLSLYAVSDLTRSVIASDNGFQFGSVVDVGWIAGYLLVALSARNPWGHSGTDTEGRDASATGGTITIFALVMVAALLSMRGAGLVAFNPSAAGLWALLVLTVAARQILLIIDNEKLRHDLERRVSERTAELREATRRSELLLTSVGEGIYGVDDTGQVTFVNPAGAEALGYRAEELIGRQAHEVFHDVAENGVAFPTESCYVTEAIRDRSATRAEADVYVRRNGRTFPVEVTATPLAADEVVSGAVVVFRDVTQRQEVDRLKNEFVSVVSHELRTPLTSIRGSLGLLAGGALGPIPAKALRMVELALDSSARLTRLINDILDLERIESGTLAMNLSDHSAEELIDAAVAQLGVLAAAAQVQLVVTEAFGVVHADADRVTQTLINLIDNAIKFSPPDGVVRVRACVTGRQVEFCVSDSGRGIPEDKLERVFSRFEQVDSSDAREKGGSGLGLAISRSMIEQQGGRIWARSAPGSGASFSFTLPLGVRVREHDEAESVARARPAEVAAAERPQPAELVS